MSADHLQNHCEKNCGVSCGIPQWFMMVLYQISLYMLPFIEFVNAIEKRHFHNASVNWVQPSNCPVGSVVWSSLKCITWTHWRYQSPGSMSSRWEICARNPNVLFSEKMRQHKKVWFKKCKNMIWQTCLLSSYSISWCLQSILDFITLKFSS